MLIPPFGAIIFTLSFLDLQVGITGLFSESSFVLLNRILARP